jgi:hypothetical protein
MPRCSVVDEANAYSRFGISRLGTCSTRDASSVRGEILKGTALPPDEGLALPAFVGARAPAEDLAGALVGRLAGPPVVGGDPGGFAPPVGGGTTTDGSPEVTSSIGANHSPTPR